MLKKLFVIIIFSKGNIFSSLEKKVKAILNEAAMSILIDRQQIAGRKVNRLWSPYSQPDTAIFQLCILREDKSEKFKPTFFNNLALEPITSNHQTVETSFVEAMQLFIRIFKNKPISGVSAYDSNNRLQQIIKMQYGLFNDSLCPGGMIIDDTIDPKDKAELSKNKLFAAQIYTELLKRRPRELDGVKIRYELEIRQKSSCCSIQ